MAANMEGDNVKNGAVNGQKSAMEVDCWKGDWGLPSVDTKCLNILTYAQFAGISLKVHKNRFLLWNPTAHLPRFRAKDETLNSDTEAIEYIQANQMNLDADLTDQQRADVLAFRALMEEQFLPGLLHVMWLDAKNYVEMTRPWYARALHFPFNYFIPGRLQRAAEARVQLTRGGDHMEPQEITDRVCNEAKECMNLLSERLGQEDFFFGQKPTSLDALIFSYLAPLLRAPLPSNQLQTHLRACDNLCRFCSRIFLRYFPEEPHDATSSPTQRAHEDPFDDAHKRRNQVLCAVVALSAMVGYAFLSGLIRLQISASDRGGIELEYDEGDDEQ